jgi:hypothetical protein
MKPFTRVAAKIANVVFQCCERVFHRGLTNLFEAFVIGRAAAHSVKILWNDRVIVIWQCKPIERLVAVVTGICSDREANLPCNRIIELR